MRRVRRTDRWLYVSVDFDTLELRALAQVCLDLFGESEMAEAIRAGQDLHLAMAASMLDISYDEAVRRRKAGDKQVKTLRDTAKVANFGLPGGLGAQTLVEYARTGYGVTLTEDQAQDLKREWLAKWPEMSRYFRYISDRVGFGDADIVQLRSGRVRGGVGYTDGCNTLFQGLAADGAKHALFNVAHECYVDLGTPLFGCRPVAFIHDEIVAEVPEDIAHEASERLARVMCDSMSVFIPDVPITASPALMRRWWKDAEAVMLDGRLIPWEPEPAKAS